ncbi:MAG: 3-oxoacyl-ACP reductase FabG [Chromatiales bacterium]|jgi:3-oxoacyl-[acyl-carrier protein] reductase|nr:3-oxoacyl-ACP reductase FabG [Chromatiales bacterium]
MSKPFEQFSLSGELALVTGASRGIGAEVADTLGRSGAKVIGTATSEAGAEAIAERFSRLGIEGQGIVMDVASAESIDAGIAEVIQEHGAVGILVNNAGITRDNLLMRMKDDEWNDVINTNLTGMFYVCKASLRGMMKARSGRVINIASVVGVMGNAGQTNYAAAKAGMIGFSKSMAREVGSRGITVNVIAPGFIQTAMTDALAEDVKSALQSRIALQKLGQAEDIANAVLFLASPAGSYITGETLHVNGGMHMV